eukprot:CAMPEP_0196659742 /NCGR_PEP_ID=MMETSP1086-20130531/36490_1 /TAXON_ID=77921 /ORGANISM="Cyanoptyche  gloeocystis , Strain SAG4.97" /LENGTH=126 /DNA_ID=CAMNT_0041993841 /DNA_START=203 /DNA_END=583 /DNA_ORIENTATION=-
MHRFAWPNSCAVCDLLGSPGAECNSDVLPVLEVACLGIDGGAGLRVAGGSGGAAVDGAAPGGTARLRVSGVPWSLLGLLRVQLAVDYVEGVRELLLEVGQLLSFGLAGGLQQHSVDEILGLVQKLI